LSDRAYDPTPFYECLAISSSFNWGSNDIGLISSRTDADTTVLKLWRRGGTITTGIRVYVRVACIDTPTIFTGSASGVLEGAPNATHPSTALTQRDGRVGIGTSSPTATLDVKGDTKITGSLDCGVGTIRTTGELKGGGTCTFGPTTIVNDIITYRTGGTTGVIYMTQDKSRYLFYDGSKYILNGNVALSVFALETGSMTLSSLTVSGITTLSTTTITGTLSANRTALGMTTISAPITPVPGGGTAEDMFITGSSANEAGVWGSYDKLLQGGNVLLTAGDGVSRGNNGSAEATIRGGHVYIRAGRASNTGGSNGSAPRTYAGAIVFQSGVLNTINNIDANTYITEMKVQGGKVGIGIDDLTVKSEALQVSGGAHVDGNVTIDNGLQAGAVTVTSLDAGAGAIVTTGEVQAKTLAVSESAGTAIDTTGRCNFGETWVRNADLRVYRSGGTTGAIFLHNGTSRYLYFSGSKYIMPNAPLSVNSLEAGSGSITTTGNLQAGAATVTSIDAGSGAIITTGEVQAGSASFGSTTVSSLDAGSGLLRTTGILDVGRVISRGNLTVAVGDLSVYRAGGTTGFVYLHNSNSRYLNYDGTSYNLPGAKLITADLQVNGAVKIGTWSNSSTVSGSFAKVYAIAGHYTNSDNTPLLINVINPFSSTSVIANVSVQNLFQSAASDDGMYARIGLISTSTVQVYICRPKNYNGQGNGANDWGTTESKLHVQMTLTT
jgi:ethanolamine utilization microcompartment shell protein EutS